MKVLVSCLIAVALLALGAGNSLGSEPWAFQVYQPFLLQDGIGVSAVTYTGYYEQGKEVEMTCWPNRVWHEKEGRSFQENSAFMTGLTASVDGLRSWPNRSDTIVVVLDVRRAHSVSETKLPGFLPPKSSWPDDSLIRATVECMKANAAQYSGVHFLALRIRGPSEFNQYGGIFNVKDRRCGPKGRQF